MRASGQGCCGYRRKPCDGEGAGVGISFLRTEEAAQNVVVSIPAARRRAVAVRVALFANDVDAST